MHRGEGKAWATGFVVVAAALAGCGSATQSEVGATSRLTTGSVAVRQSGTAQVQLQQSSVTYRLDDSGGLVVTLSVTSEASSAQTIMARATLYSSSGAVIGDASGGTTAVPAGGTATLQLNGPAPQGTIASAVFEITALNAPTPIAGTPPPTPTYSP